MRVQAGAARLARRRGKGGVMGRDNPLRPLTKDEARRARMRELAVLCSGPAPERYRAAAELWRLHAEESAAPEECLAFANNQDRLATDMESRPAYYARKPADKTDWEWSQKSASGAKDAT